MEFDLKLGHGVQMALTLLVKNISTSLVAA